MSFYYFSSSTDPMTNLAIKRELSKNPVLTPTLYMYECADCTISGADFEALAISSKHISGGPVFIGGCGSLMYSFISANIPNMLSRELNILKRALINLDTPADISENSLTVNGYSCLDSTAFTDRGKLIHNGAIYFDLPDDTLAELNRLTERKHLNLKSFNKCITRSYLIGAVKYEFEREFGKAFYLSDISPLNEKKAGLA